MTETDCRPRHAALPVDVTTIKVEVEWQQVVRYSTTTTLELAALAEYHDVDLGRCPEWRPTPGQVTAFLNEWLDDQPFVNQVNEDTDREGSDDAEVTRVTSIEDDDPGAPLGGYPRRGAPATVTQTTCHNCTLDVEGPDDDGRWWDRGNNSHCPNGIDLHFPS